MEAGFSLPSEGSCDHVITHCGLPGFFYTSELTKVSQAAAALSSSNPPPLLSEAADAALRAGLAVCCGSEKPQQTSV